MALKGSLGRGGLHGRSRAVHPVKVVSTPSVTAAPGLSCPAPFSGSRGGGAGGDGAPRSQAWLPGPPTRSEALCSRPSQAWNSWSLKTKTFSLRNRNSFENSWGVRAACAQGQVCAAAGGGKWGQRAPPRWAQGQTGRQWGHFSREVVMDFRGQGPSQPGQALGDSAPPEPEAAAPSSKKPSSFPSSISPRQASCPTRRRPAWEPAETGPEVVPREFIASLCPGAKVTGLCPSSGAWAASRGPGRPGG